MTTDAEYEELKKKIIDHLSSLEGKQVDTIISISKATGVKRRAASKAISRMETDGLIAPAGVMAGVAGYKLVK